MPDVFIEKKNELDIVLDCEQHVLYELQEAFSFDVEGASFAPAFRKKYWDGKIRLCSVATKSLPAGLTYQLCKWLDRQTNFIVRNLGRRLVASNADWRFGMFLADVAFCPQSSIL